MLKPTYLGTAILALALGTASPAAARPAEPAAGQDPSYAPAEKTEKRKDKKRASRKKTELELTARVYTLFMLRDEQDAPPTGFRINSARLELDWAQAKLLDANLELEVSNMRGGFESRAPLRNAYLRIKPDRAFRIRVGQFKKPFSRLELRGRRRLDVIRRGLTNTWIVEYLRFGDRDIGLQLEGRFGRKTGLRYALGVFNGEGANRLENDDPGNKNIVGRVVSDPTKWLSVGFSFSSTHHRPAINGRRNRPALMIEADFEIRTKRFGLLGEAMAGQTSQEPPEPPPPPYKTSSWSLLLLTSYKIPLTEWYKLALQPVLKGEILKPDSSVADAHIWMGTAGANLLVGKNLRLMIHGEAARPAPNVPPSVSQNWSSGSRLMVQLAVHL